MQIRANIKLSGAVDIINGQVFEAVAQAVALTDFGLQSHAPSPLGWLPPPPGPARPAVPPPPPAAAPVANDAVLKMLMEKMDAMAGRMPKQAASPQSEASGHSRRQAQKRKRSKQQAKKKVQPAQAAGSSKDHHQGRGEDENEDDAFSLGLDGLDVLEEHRTARINMHARAANPKARVAVVTRDKVFVMRDNKEARREVSRKALAEAQVDLEDADSDNEGVEAIPVAMLEAVSTELQDRYALGPNQARLTTLVEMRRNLQDLADLFCVDLEYGTGVGQKAWGRMSQKSSVFKAIVASLAIGAINFLKIQSWDTVEDVDFTHLPTPELLQAAVNKVRGLPAGEK